MTAKLWRLSVYFSSLFVLSVVTLLFIPVSHASDTDVGDININLDLASVSPNCEVCMKKLKLLEEKIEKIEVYTIEEKRKELNGILQEVITFFEQKDFMKAIKYLEELLVAVENMQELISHAPCLAHSIKVVQECIAKHCIGDQLIIDSPESSICVSKLEMMIEELKNTPLNHPSSGQLRNRILIPALEAKTSLQSKHLEEAKDLLLQVISLISEFRYFLPSHTALADGVRHVIGCINQMNTNTILEGTSQTEQTCSPSETCISILAQMKEYSMLWQMRMNTLYHEMKEVATFSLTSLLNHLSSQFLTAEIEAASQYYETEFGSVCSTKKVKMSIDRIYSLLVDMSNDYLHFMMQQSNPSTSPAALNHLKFLCKEFKNCLEE